MGAVLHKGSREEKKKETPEEPEAEIIRKQRLARFAQQPQEVPKESMPEVTKGQGLPHEVHSPHTNLEQEHAKLPTEIKGQKKGYAQIPQEEEEETISKITSKGKPMELEEEKVKPEQRTIKIVKVPAKSPSPRKLRKLPLQPVEVPPVEKPKEEVKKKLEEKKEDTEKKMKEKQEWLRAKKFHMLICGTFEVALSDKDIPKRGGENYLLMDDLVNEKKKTDQLILFTWDDIEIVLETKLQLLAGVFSFSKP